MAGQSQGETGEGKIPQAKHAFFDNHPYKVAMPRKFAASQKTPPPFSGGGPI